MVKNKVVLKEREIWSNLANFIGEMVAKYAESMDLDNLPDPDFYLHRERIRQLKFRRNPCSKCHCNIAMCISSSTISACF
jgi:hypothetical protein